MENGLNTVSFYEISSIQTNLLYLIYELPNFLERENRVRVICLDFNGILETSWPAKKHAKCPPS